MPTCGVMTMIRLEGYYPAKNSKPCLVFKIDVYYTGFEIFYGKCTFLGAVRTLETLNNILAAILRVISPLFANNIETYILWHEEKYVVRYLGFLKMPLDIILHSLLN